MICPKCSREMSSEASVCDYCGFTFQTPKTSDRVPAAPYGQSPSSKTASAVFSGSATQDARSGDRSAVQKPLPPPPVYTTSTPYPIYAERVQAEPLSIGQYIGMILLTIIPVVGLIVMIVWAVNRNVNPNRRHFAGAVLILKALSLIFLLGACIVFFVYNAPFFFYVFPY